jgi:hypothetical protein
VFIASFFDVGFTVDTVTLGQVFFRGIYFFLAIISSLLLDNRLSSGAGTVGYFVGTKRSDFNLPLQKCVAEH